MFKIIKGFYWEFKYARRRKRRWDIGFHFQKWLPYWTRSHLAAQWLHVMIIWETEVIWQSTVIYYTSVGFWRKTASVLHKTASALQILLKLTTLIYFRTFGLPRINHELTSGLAPPTQNKWNCLGHSKQSTRYFTNEFFLKDVDF